MHGSVSVGRCLCLNMDQACVDVSPRREERRNETGGEGAAGVSLARAADILLRFCITKTIGTKTGYRFFG